MNEQLKKIEAEFDKEFPCEIYHLRELEIHDQWQDRSYRELAAKDFKSFLLKTASVMYLKGREDGVQNALNIIENNRRDNIHMSSHPIIIQKQDA